MYHHYTLEKHTFHQRFVPVWEPLQVVSRTPLESKEPLLIQRTLGGHFSCVVGITTVITLLRDPKRLFFFPLRKPFNVSCGTIQQRVSPVR